MGLCLSLRLGRCMRERAALACRVYSKTSIQQLILGQPKLQHLSVWLLAMMTVHQLPPSRRCSILRNLTGLVGSPVARCQARRRQLPKRKDAYKQWPGEASHGLHDLVRTITFSTLSIHVCSLHRAFSTYIRVQYLLRATRNHANTPTRQRTNTNQPPLDGLSCDRMLICASYSSDP